MYIVDIGNLRPFVLIVKRFISTPAIKNAMKNKWRKPSYRRGNEKWMRVELFASIEIGIGYITGKNNLSLSVGYRGL